MSRLERGLHAGAVRHHSRVSAMVILAVLTAAFVVLPPAPARAGPGWIVSCQLSHQSHDDPIVFPGQPGMAHLHLFYGARGTNAFSVPDTMRMTGTSCAMPGDTSAYWIPAVYAQGMQLMPGTTKHALFYYRRIAAPTGMTVATIPDGLRFVIGNPHAMSPAENPLLGRRIWWRCGTGGGARLPQPPSTCGAQTMVLIFQGPNCWDGVNLDSPDHFSHMAYPVGSRCPTTHPVNIPRVESYFRFRITPGPLGEVFLSSGPWWTLHQDVFFSWVPTEIQRFTAGCIAAGRDCRQNPI
jgi:hypothetical protein